MRQATYDANMREITSPIDAHIIGIDEDNKKLHLEEEVENKMTDQNMNKPQKNQWPDPKVLQQNVHIPDDDSVSTFCEGVTKVGEEDSHAMKKHQLIPSEVTPSTISTTTSFPGTVKTISQLKDELKTEFITTMIQVIRQLLVPERQGLSTQEQDNNSNTTPARNKDPT